VGSASPAAALALPDDCMFTKTAVRFRDFFFFQQKAAYEIGQ